MWCHILVRLEIIARIVQQYMIYVYIYMYIFVHVNMYDIMHVYIHVSVYIYIHKQTDRSILSFGDPKLLGLIRVSDKWAIQFSQLHYPLTKLEYQDAPMDQWMEWGAAFSDQAMFLLYYPHRWIYHIQCMCT